MGHLVTFATKGTFSSLPQICPVIVRQYYNKVNRSITYDEGLLINSTLGWSVFNCQGVVLTWKNMACAVVSRDLDLLR